MSVKGFIVAQASPVLGNTGSVTWDSVKTAIYNLLQTILIIAELFAVAAIVYYGFRIATGGGKSGEKSLSAQRGLWYAIIGALIIFGVYTILATVKGAATSIGH